MANRSIYLKHGKTLQIIHRVKSHGDRAAGYKNAVVAHQQNFLVSQHTSKTPAKEPNAH